MLSLTRVTANQASSYYTADDYYLQEVGHWYGQLADALGYTGHIQEKDFQSLINGVDNRADPRFEIQSGGKDNIHTAGVDLTFSAPKSVSIAGLILDDKRIIEAHNKAVNEALNYIEKNYTNVRIHEGNKIYTEFTGNLMAAKFQHISSRELDPQLHTHCLVMNITAKENGDKRAMDFGDIYNAKMLLGQMYRSELAANLKEIGYDIESDSKGLFELKGMPDNLIKEFSLRSEQIQQRFEELKEQFPTANLAELKAIATIDTRKVKDEPSIDELKQQWSERTEQLNINKDRLTNELGRGKSITEASKDINSVVERAVHIATEHEAVAKLDDILRVAAKISMGEHRVQEIKDALEKSQNVIRLNDKKYTTFEIAEMECKIINQVITGKDTVVGLDKISINQGILDYQINKGFKLTEGQREAVVHILSSNDRIIAIQGDAGTGKTTVLDVVRTIAEKEHKEVLGLSFTGKAASEIEDASSIQSRTIASLVNSNDDLKGKLVVIDEASMLSIKDMNQLMNKCDENTRVVLIGDTKQLQTIGQGKIFSSLQEKEAINTVRMSEVQRQKDADYKDVVDKLGDKQINAAFEKLETKNLINEIVDRAERLSTITKTYLERPKESIIVTATNKDREELNQMIREELIKSGIVKDDVVNYVTHEIRSLTGEEKFFAENYAVKDIIVANTAGIIGKAGAEAKVTAVDKEQNMLTVKADNKLITIALNQYGNYLQVYSEKSRVFAKGDKILFLKNDKGLDVKNGQAGYIKAIRKDGGISVKLENGKAVQFNPEKQYKYIGHGYALTDYKSQGQTEKHVIYHADTRKGVNYNQAYVGITRGKESVTIYTNDKEILREMVKQEQQKTTTLDHNLREARSANKAKLDNLASRLPNMEYSARMDKSLKALEHTPSADKVNAAVVNPEKSDLIKNRVITKDLDKGFGR
jgi:conjugative relaxase-like TrwC/TraI family protein